MPSRFTVLPDVTAEASGRLSDVLEQAKGRAVELKAVLDKLLANASNASGFDADGAWEWLRGSGSNASSVADEAVQQVGMPPRACALLLLAVFVWMFREMLVRASTRQLVRSYGHAHHD